MRLRKSFQIAALMAALAQVSCTEPEPIIQYDYDPHEGEVYPDNRPKLTIPPSGMGVVSDSLSDTLSFIDLATGKRFATYPVGREPVTIDGPHHVVVDVQGGAVYVALSYPVLAGAVGPHATHGSSTTSGWAQKLALDDLRVLGQVRVDPNPGEIVLSQDGKRLVVSHFDLKRALDNPTDLDAARSTIALIDPAALMPSGSPDPVRIPICIAAHGMVLSRPDGARAYVACYGEDALAVADLTNPSAEPKRIPVGPGATAGNPTYGPYGAVMSPDGKTIAVSSTVIKDVRFFDVATETFDDTKTIKTVGAPFFVAWSEDGTRLFIPTQQPDALVVADLSTSQQVDYRDLTGTCGKPHVVELSGPSDLFVVCEGDQKTAGDVLKVGVTTLDTVVTEKVGVYPDAFFRVAGGTL
jgi:DNA-binding beta-propeller fold protein YncE